MYSTLEKLDFPIRNIVRYLSLIITFSLSWNRGPHLHIGHSHPPKKPETIPKELQESHIGHKACHAPILYTLWGRRWETYTQALYGSCQSQGSKWTTWINIVHTFMGIFRHESDSKIIIVITQRITPFNYLSYSNSRCRRKAFYHCHAICIGTARLLTYWYATEQFPSLFPS